MKTRMLLFTVGLFGGFLLLFGFTPEPWNFLALAWVFALMLAQFLIFRCPHCKEVAVITPSGWTTPFVGSACRYCGEPY